MRPICAIVLAITATAADRYVSTNGTDAGACDNIAAPCATLDYADNQSVGGDTIYVRGGRYTTTAANFVVPSAATTASARLTIRSYPGEVVVFDCQSASGRRFANFTIAGVGYYTFAGFSIRNVHSSYGPILAQGRHPSIEIKGLRIESAGFGIIINPSVDGSRHRILGSHLTNGISTGFDCSAQTGTNNGDYVGCSDLIIQDTVLTRTATGSDHVGMEAGSNILLSRVVIESQTQVANDCVDIKANNVWFEDLTSVGCSTKGATAWGYTRYRHVRTNGTAWVMSEYSSRDIDDAVDDGGFIRITASYDPWGGQVPIPGHRVTITNVLGCTGANGTWTIKDAVSKNVFRIMGSDGSGTSCGGTHVYNASSSVRMAPPLDLQYGADVRYSTFAVAGGAAVNMLYNMPGSIPWRMHDSIVSSAATSGSIGICASAIGPIRTSDRNQFWTGRGQAYATGYSGGGTCATYDGNNLAANEPASNFGNPNLDAVTMRATATSPVTLVNRGYYSGTNTVTPGEDGQVIRFRAPAATDNCTVDLDDNADFSSPLVTLTSGPGSIWREVAFGSLMPSTTYHHRITCGYDRFTGSAATLAAVSGTASATRTLAPPADSQQTQAVLDYYNGSAWVAGSPAACGSGCSISTAALNRGQIYLVRHRRLSAGGTTLAASRPAAEVIP